MSRADALNRIKELKAAYKTAERHIITTPARSRERSEAIEASEGAYTAWQDARTRAQAALQALRRSRS